jgi:hypothetical protein
MNRKASVEGGISVPDKARNEEVNCDKYCLDRRIRRILDKKMNQIILSIIEMEEEFLRKHEGLKPEIFGAAALACHGFPDHVVLKNSPIVKRRNEVIHEYRETSWQSIITARNRIKEG